MKNNDDLEKKFLVQFKKQVGFLKNTIVSLMKKEKRLINEIKKINEDERREMISEAKEVRIQLELCRKTLDDLTYAYIQEFSNYSGRLLKRFNCETAEEYLGSRYEDNRPKLTRIIDVISRVDTDNLDNGMPLSMRLKPLKELYTVYYTDNGSLSVERKKINDIDYSRERREDSIFSMNDVYKSEGFIHTVDTSAKHK